MPRPTPTCFGFAHHLHILSCHFTCLRCLVHCATDRGRRTTGAIIIADIIKRNSAGGVVVVIVVLGQVAGEALREGSSRRVKTRQQCLGVDHRGNGNAPGLHEHALGPIRVLLNFQTWGVLTTVHVSRRACHPRAGGGGHGVQQI